MRNAFRLAAALSSICLLGTLAHAQLTISDVRRVGTWTWQAAPKSASWNVTVDGLVARTRLTLEIADTLSTVGSDSLEAVFKFTMPKGTTVDSLYLWINGAPVPAMMLEKGFATQIYEQIVSRRRDPAILTRTQFTQNYELRIFPYKRREVRTVRVCYYQALTTQDSTLSVAVPTSMFRYATMRVGKSDVTVTHRNSRPEAISLGLPRGFSIGQWQFFSGSCIIRASANLLENNSEDMTVSLVDSTLAATGMLFQFSQMAAGDVAFVGVLNPARLCGYKGSGTFSPANLTISAKDTGFVYDVYGDPATYRAGTSVFYTGRIHRNSTLSMSFNGVIGGTDYSFRGTASPTITRTTDPGVAATWANLKAASIGAPDLTDAYGRVYATDLCMTYRVLTPYTALLAIEPGMETGFSGTTGTPGDGQSLALTSGPTAHGSTPGAAGMRIAHLEAGVRLLLDAVPTGADVELRIYDVNGRLVTDLSASARTSHNIVWRTVGVRAGAYVIRMTCGGKTVSRQITLSR